MKSSLIALSSCSVPLLMVNTRYQGKFRGDSGVDQPNTHGASSCVNEQSVNRVAVTLTSSRSIDANIKLPLVQDATRFGDQDLTSTIL